MLFVANVLVVELVGTDPLLAVGGAQQGDEVALEVGAVGLNVLLRILAHDVHLANVRLGLDVAFEAVGVSALLLTGFAPPAEALEAFGLHLVREMLRASDFGARHRGGCAGATSTSVGLCACARLRLLYVYGARAVNECAGRVL